MTLEEKLKNEIISYYMRTIKGTAGYFGVPKSYVGKIINEEKKRN